MLEFFTNPGFLAVAGALVSAPIIIHLINRMRFKRIHWAAMEFLLKAQKRARRRLIIEQLLLLALRCLLVAMVGLLVARFVGASFADIGAKPVMHVVVLDDTLSMNDQWKEGETTKSAFMVALKDVFLDKIVRAMGQSSGTDQLVLLPLSEVHLNKDYNPKPFTKLNDKGTINDLGQALYALYGDKHGLDERKGAKEWSNLSQMLASGGGQAEQWRLDATSLHVPVLAGVKKAQEIINANPESRITLHILSDFRQREWAAPDGEALHKLLVQLAKEHTDLKVRLIDAVSPYRTATQTAAPVSHENVGIVDVRAGTRVAGKDMPVTFTVTLANYSAREAEVNLVVFDDASGKEKFEVDFSPSMPIKIPAGSTDTKATFELRFNPQIKAGATHFEQLSVRLESAQRGKLDSDGLQQDNVRHVAVEIRDKVPVLIVDGEGARGRQDNMDSFFLKTAIISVPGASYEIENGDELMGGIPAKVFERGDLMKYPTIFVANLRELTTKQLANLENYVREGGGVCFFMGPLVNAEYYKKSLYKDGQGLLPVPLRDTYKPPSTEEPLKPRYTGDDQLLLREDLFGKLDALPIFGAVFKDETQKVRLKDLPVKRYYEVPRSAWRQEPGRVFELATLPNDLPATAYQGAAVALLKGSLLQKIFDDNEELRKYQKGIDRHRRVIEGVVAPASEKSAFALAASLDAMLQDKGKEKERNDYPNLTEFWSYPDPKIATLRKEVTDLRDQAKYGDPFVVASTFGKGKVVAVMTTAGKEWNDWGGGSDASVLFQPFIWELQNYLSSQGSEAGLTCGTPIQITVDPDAFKQKGTGRLKITRVFRKPLYSKPAKEVHDVELFGQENKGSLTFAFDRNMEPGMYVSNLHFGDGADKAIPLAVYGHVFNVDTLKEGPLARVAYDDIDKSIIREAPQDAVVFEGPGIAADSLVSRRSDLSESPWLFLLFIAVLVAEQALAVHLSFHLKGNETVALTRRAA
jgi:hypothetical protein